MVRYKESSDSPGRELVARAIRSNSMRSEYVFAAARKIGNRYLLCSVTAGSAHRLKKPQRQFAESINQSLNLIAYNSIAGSYQADPAVRNAGPGVLWLRKAS